MPICSEHDFSKTPSLIAYLEVTVHKLKAFSVFVSAMCLLTANVAAQSAQLFSVQGSALYEKVQGDASQWRVDESLPAGYGAEAQLRYTPGLLSWGGGLQGTSHSWTDSGKESNLRMIGVFLEPRYVLPATGRLGPYISARLALTTLKLKIADVDIGDATGKTINGGGGVLVALSPRINLDVGATFGYTNFGDLMKNNAPTGLKTGSGTNLIARVGLAIGLGK